MGKESCPSNNDLPMSMLINEGASGSLQSYYELVRVDDLYARRGLLLRRKRLCEIQIKKRILSELPGRRSLGQLSPGDILTTCLPLGDADIYYSSSSRDSRKFTLVRYDAMSLLL